MKIKLLSEKEIQCFRTLYKLQFHKTKKKKVRFDLSKNQIKLKKRIKPTVKMTRSGKIY